MPSAAEVIKRIPPLFGMPRDDVNSMYVTDHWQIAFCLVDRWIYDTVVLPYLPLFQDLLQNYTKDYPGPGGVAWHDQPWEPLTQDQILGNEIGASYGIGDRRALRRGERGSKMGQLSSLRNRKTATSIMVSARFNEARKIQVFRTPDAQKSLDELKDLLDPTKRSPDQNIVFDFHLEGEGNVSPQFSLAQIFSLLKLWVSYS